MSRIARWSLLPAFLIAPAFALLASSGHASLESAYRPAAPEAAQARARNRYEVIPLVADDPLQAAASDRNLVNPWGLTRGPAGPWWISDNGTDKATLYDGDGVANPLVVSLPPGASPTGIVFNIGESFAVTDGVSSQPALFLFAGEGGGIFGWNPLVPPPIPSPNAFLVHAEPGAIYKGLAIATTGAGDRLYATDFHNRRVDVYDGAFQPVVLPEGAFIDRRLPEGFSPFGIQNIQGRIFVTYAKQDADGEDDVAGQGLGFVSVFDTDGAFLARIATRGPLNAPWGIVLAPAAFGRFGGDLLVGNFGDGKILAYHLSDDFRKAHLDGVLREMDGRPVVVEGLWGLGFGNNLGAGSSDTLFFTAGPGDEQHGLFGRIEAR